MRYDECRLADFRYREIPNGGRALTERSSRFLCCCFSYRSDNGALVELRESLLRSGNVTGGNAAYFVRQLIFALLGIGCMLLASKLPMGFYRSYALHFLLLTLVLLMLVPVIGVKANGSRRWLGIGGLTLQPSELAKLAVILSFAWLICPLPRADAHGAQGCCRLRGYCGDSGAARSGSRTSRRRS